MDIFEAIENRHSVRRYLDKKIPSDIIEILKNEIYNCNVEGALNIQLITDRPEAFLGIKASYGKLSNVSCYIALVGKKSKTLDYRVGYYGERIVIKAQQLGLNTCWLGGTYSKRKAICELGEGECLRLVIAIGYGATQGHARKSKAVDEVASVYEGTEMPEWFIKGAECALKAPTALNQQKFKFILWRGRCVIPRSGTGFFTKVDLGIAMYHFELGAGFNNFVFTDIR